jgi:hypothetical protein
LRRTRFAFCRRVAPRTTKRSARRNTEATSIVRRRTFSLPIFLGKFADFYTALNGTNVGIKAARFQSLGSRGLGAMQGRVELSRVAKTHLLVGRGAFAQGVW